MILNCISTANTHATQGMMLRDGDVRLAFNSGESVTFIPQQSTLRGGSPNSGGIYDKKKKRSGYTVKLGIT